MERRTILTLQTAGRGLLEVTEKINAWLGQQDTLDGLCHCFILHTSASLTVMENADPQVLEDLQAFFNRLVVDGDPLFKHTQEGPDDMPSHIKNSLTQTSLSIPVMEKRLFLGTWQGVFLWEHRRQPQQRQVVLTRLPA